MSIGQRIACGKKKGTIQYVGEVPPHRGIYYGVDWDVPEDGKHNGYPTSGSFIKTAEANFGYKFVEAAVEQYDYDYAKSCEECAQDIKELKALLNVTHLELVGFDKVRKLQGPLKKMRVVSLSAYHVNSPGEYGEIEETCPCVQDLELTDSLMTSWEQVAVIGKQLKDLRILKLNNTRLSIPDNAEDFKEHFPKLTELIMCSCPYTWDDILKGSAMWPQLQILRVPLNRVTSLEEPRLTLQDLCMLDLLGNPIYHWSEINKLGNLKKLEVLNISKTGIDEIDIPRDKNLFPALVRLFIADNNIKSWAAMADLNNLPSLKILKFKRNPVMKNYEPPAYREKIIARIANLQILNGQEILPEERRGAEYDYVKEMAEEWNDSDKSDIRINKFLRENPRYLKLVEIYGTPDTYKPADPSIKSKLLSVTLMFTSKDGIIKKTLTKKFHCSMVIYKLVAVVKRLFNMGSERPKLTYISAVNPDVKLDMENDLKTLDSYGVTDGDTVIVGV